MANQPPQYTKIVAEDKRAVAYRPNFARLTGSVTAAVLLQQILFYADKHGSKPFYKFKSPCAHKKYTSGDSWCEELGFSRAEFDNALKKIGTKISKGRSKGTLSAWKMPEQSEWKDDDLGFGAALNIAVQHLITYWTDGSRITWYQVNTDLLNNLLCAIYDAKVEILLYLDKARNQRYLGKAKNGSTYNTEISQRSPREKKDSVAKPQNEKSKSILEKPESEIEISKPISQNGNGKIHFDPGRFYVKTESAAVGPYKSLTAASAYSHRNGGTVIQGTSTQTQDITALAAPPRDGPDKLFSWIARNITRQDPDIAWNSPKQKKYVFTLLAAPVNAEKRLLGMETLSQGARDTLADKMTGFPPWYEGKCQGCSMPKDVTKFETWINQWYEECNQKPVEMERVNYPDGTYTLRPK